MSRSVLSALIVCLGLAVPAHAQYCAAPHVGVDCAFDEYISNVTIGTLNNASTCVPGTAYEDFTALPAPTLAVGVANPISITVTQVFTGQFFNTVSVYCDWNGDFDFIDAFEETILTPPAVASTMVWTGNITPPVGAVATTRMRIRVFWSPNPQYPCGNPPLLPNGYGNTEDYTINTTTLDFQGVGAAGTNPVTSGTGSTLLTVAFTSVLPPSPPTGVSATIDLSSMGGSAAQALFDNGTSGDVTAGDNTFSFNYAVPPGVFPGQHVLPWSAIDGIGRTASGNILLNVLPSNDECASALPVGLGANGPYANTGATNSLGASISCGVAGSIGHKDVWFSFTPTCSGTYQIDTVAPPFFDTSLGVFDGCGGSEIACNDDEPLSLASLVTVALNGGSTYIIRVASWDTIATGPFMVNIAQLPALAWASPAPATITWDISGGPAGGTYFHAIWFVAGNFPNGYFFGIDIPFQEVLNQAAAGFPFVGPLDGCGANFFGPIAPVPSGLPLFSVALLMTGPGLTGSVVATPPASHTIL